MDTRRASRGRQMISMSRNQMTRPPNLRLVLLAAAGLVLVLAACQTRPEGAAGVVWDSIERHGGEVFDRIHIRWGFRGVPFEVTRDDGRFRYQRTVQDSLGQAIVEVMENEGSWIEVNGERQDLDPQSRARLEFDVNSVVYFGFLPFRLDDPVVQLADLGTGEVEGELYRKVGVTFEREGGGLNWEDRFVYWFHEGDHTLDYLAHLEAADVETTRFRRAVNRREVGGLLVQDYENYTGDPDVGDVADYDRLFEAGSLRLLSMVEFDDLEVSVVGEVGRGP